MRLTLCACVKNKGVGYLHDIYFFETGVGSVSFLFWSTGPYPVLYGGITRNKTALQGTKSPPKSR